MLTHYCFQPANEVQSKTPPAHVHSRFIRGYYSRRSGHKPVLGCHVLEPSHFALFGYSFDEAGDHIFEIAFVLLEKPAKAPQDRQADQHHDPKPEPVSSQAGEQQPETASAPPTNLSQQRPSGAQTTAKKFVLGGQRFSDSS